MAERKNIFSPDNPHPLSTRKTELVWDGKYDEYGNRREVDIAGCAMPMQKIDLDCQCQKNSVVNSNNILYEFGNLRNQCAALRKILLPDNIWNDFHKVHLFSDNASHCSILLLAFERGHLKEITSPIHKYFLKEGKPIINLNPNYIKDLQEHWMKQKNECERHKKAKIFQGKLVELQIAEWLEQQGWNIINLEAKGGEHDIECTDPSDINTAIQVKFIGQKKDEDEFLISAGTGTFSSYPLYTGINIVLLRVYESAITLQSSNKKKIAIIVISEMFWPFVKIPITENWIDWKSPRFYENDTDWEELLRKEEKDKEYFTIKNNLSKAINTLDELWIVTRQEGFNYLIQRRIPIG